MYEIGTTRFDGGRTNKATFVDDSAQHAMHLQQALPDSIGLRTVPCFVIGKLPGPRQFVVDDSGQCALQCIHEGMSARMGDDRRRISVRSAGAPDGGEVE